MTARRTEALAATLAGLGWTGLLYGGGLDRERVLATRDALVFHLPLRSDLARLVADGSAWWNPWIHGGQPVFSNPNYAAFYPPTWSGFVLEPHYALGLGMVLHAALAFAGACVLVRRLGGGTAAAALAAVGWSGCGAFLSLTHAYTAFSAAAWWPWTLAAADAAFDPARSRRRTGAPDPVPRRAWWPAAGATAATLALQLLAGEPMIAAAAALAVAILALSRALRRPLRPTLLGRLAAVALLTVLLSMVQLLPTARQHASSPRAGGLAAEEALTWSLHPERLLEVAYPRIFGDPARYAAGFYFGAPFHDRPYAYLPALHPGLVLLVPGLAALLAGGIPRRRAWAGIAAAGLVLALGRFTPLYRGLQAAVPPFTAFRYPEKLALLLTAALVFAGALGWGRLLARGAEGPRLPMLLAGLLASGAAAVLGMLWMAPAVVSGWLAEAAPRPLSAAGLERGLGYLRVEALVALVLALAVTLLLALVRRPRFPRPALAAAALLLLAVDLHHHGAGLLRWLSFAEIASPPAVASDLVPGARVFSDDELYEGPQRVVLEGDPALQPVRSQLARLDPYSGNLWGIPYALTADFDRMDTSWHRRTAAVLATEWPRAERVLPLLGAWNVGSLVLRGPLAGEGPPEPADGRVRVVRNPYLLPRLRSVPRVRFHPSPEAALAAVAAQDFRVERVDHWVGTPPPSLAAEAPTGEATVLSGRQRGGDLVLRVRSTGTASLVVADSFHPGWRASFDGRPLPLNPTALGQIGLVLPAGEGELELVYRDPSVLPGAAVTLLTLGILLVAGVVARWRRWPATDAST